MWLADFVHGVFRIRIKEKKNTAFNRRRRRFYFMLF
jgi:hypothetical protein